MRHQFMTAWDRPLMGTKRVFDCDRHCWHSVIFSFPHDSLPHEFNDYEFARYNARYSDKAPALI